jgi:hypothetical protein
VDKHDTQVKTQGANEHERGTAQGKAKSHRAAPVQIESMHGELHECSPTVTTGGGKGGKGSVAITAPAAGRASDGLEERGSGAGAGCCMQGRLLERLQGRLRTSALPPPCKTL